MEHYHERILIVEDDPQIRNFIGYALRQEGFGCITANSGESALNALVSEPVDMMLLDLGLPRMDGMDVLKNVREWSEMPVIIVSARDQDKEKAAALDAGADDYLTKPFSATELLARIRVHSAIIIKEPRQRNRPPLKLEPETGSSQAGCFFWKEKFCI